MAMTTLITLLVAIAFVAVLHKPLKKAPWVFYLLALAIDVLVVFYSQMDVPAWLYRLVVVPNVRCVFAFCLFTIVMFTGVFKRGSAVRRVLVSIRAELSIFAALLTICHVARYISVFSPRVLQGPASVSNGMLVSFVVAVLLVLFLVALTVTSFNVVKRHMGGALWKNVQRFAYPFFVLIYAHVLLIMIRSALSGGESALGSLAVYGAIVAVYVVLRVRRYLGDRHANLEPAERETAA